MTLQEKRPRAICGGGGDTGEKCTRRVRLIHPPPHSIYPLRTDRIDKPQAFGRTAESLHPVFLEE